MKTYWKRKWIAALRSGKYKQGKSFLKSRAKGGKVYSHCCLGVLCEVVRENSAKHAEAMPITESLEDCFATDTKRLVTKYSNNHNGEVLPKYVADLVGFTDTLGLYAHNPGVHLKNGGFAKLSSLNDGSRSAGRVSRSFQEIADIIEESGL